ncbi:pilus assembly protein TadG-related protein [Streptomyces sp. NPDC048527]|uniref:pilus assembly protein TadG-related protein n=1 Tax=Streptomyces sp. NPDC048527 TaxID=3365568 RepID=UPI00371BF384
MIATRLHDDRGQTLPIYIWLTAILLFAAFAFFAFAQAASARNGAQSAADAAALAAAQDARDELMDGLGASIGKDDDWPDWLGGETLTGDGARGAADELAADNDARVIAFGLFEVNGRPGYRAKVESNSTVGESVIPGTETRHAKAEATAVVEPRCQVAPSADPKKVVEFDCDGGDSFDFDPEDFEVGDLPDASVLFSVHLAD